jgi:hypothetical protein
MFDSWTSMPEPKKTLVFFEGDDDKAFLEKLRDARIWPAGWQLAERMKEQHPGKDGLIRQLLPVVNPKNGIGGHAVVLVDLDDLSADKLAVWFSTTLTQELHKTAADVQVQDGAADGRVRSFRIVFGEKAGRVALLAIGCPDDEELKSTYKIDRFAIDDWVFRLALNQTVYEAVSDLKEVQFAVAKTKYLEVADLFRKNGLEVRKTKTYMQILRALAAIRPATATIVGRLAKKGVEALGEAQFRTLLRPFFEDLEAAERVLAVE